MATELYKHPKWDSAVGCAFLGGFYNVAPWPVGNKQARHMIGKDCAREESPSLIARPSATAFCYRSHAICVCGQKAAKYLREGVSIAPTRRNLYYAGVNAYQLREYDKAVSFFSRALAAPICEVDYAGHPTHA